MTVQTGVVKFYNDEKGFGFITPDGSDQDVFLHIKELKRAGIPAQDIAAGGRMAFTPEPGKKGLKAVNLKLLA